MNIADLAFFGFPSDFGSFFNFILFLTNTSIAFIFIIWVLNFIFSLMYNLVMYLGGVRRDGAL